MKGLEAVKGIAPPGTIKTHLPFERAPWNPNSKYIVALRNPKDACVSFYHHTKRLTDFYDYDGDFHDYFRFWIDGDVDYGDYFSHTLSWWKHRNKNNVLLMIFEDIKKDSRAEVLRIAEFLGKEYLDKLKKDNEKVLNKVLEYSSFGYMQSVGGAGHFRKGEVGDWRNHFTKEESDAVDAKFKASFSGTGLDQLWNKELAF